MCGEGLHRGRDNFTYSTVKAVYVPANVCWINKVYALYHSIRKLLSTRDECVNLAYFR